MAPRRSALSLLGGLCGGLGGPQETGVPGFYLVKNFLTAEQEGRLLQAIDADAEPWTARRTRITKNYGPFYIYSERNTAEGRFRVTDGNVFHTPVPDFVHALVLPQLRERVDMLASFAPNQIHVALYRRDERDRIRMHNDNKMGLLGPYIVGICMGAPCTMTFQRPSDGKRKLVRLPRFSCYVMSGESHREWRHGILTGHTSANRVSITLRDVRRLGVKRGVQVYRSSRIPSVRSIARQLEKDEQDIEEKMLPPDVDLSKSFGLM